MPFDAQALYARLQHAYSTIPDATVPNISLEEQKWMADLYVLVDQSRDKSDIETIKKCQMLCQNRMTRAEGRRQIIPVLMRHLAMAEANAPATAQGAFIPAGNVYDAMLALSKVVASASSDLLIVDPYLDDLALSDFALSAPETANIRLLTDPNQHKATLRPAVERWKIQNVATRALEARVSAPRVLHDRLMIVDGSDVWILTQSLKDFAKPSPASLSKSDTELAQLKVIAYADIWSNSSPL